MKLYLTFVILFLSHYAYAQTTVYETTDSNGVPAFTNIPQKNDAAAKKIVIPDAPTPTAAATVQQRFNQQQSVITDQLQKIDSTEQQLKAQIDKAQANLNQAEENLRQARDAMQSGDYTVCGDQYIDQDYVKDLELKVDQAKQQLTTAETAYDNYRDQQK